jgi:amino acid adenylation domain-containing protein
MTLSFPLESPADDANAVKENNEEVFVFPVSFSQERLWFLDQFEPGSPFYNIPVAIGFPHGLDRPALQRALSLIVARHEVLRTTFATLDSRPVQIVHPRLDLPLPLTDLRRLPPDEFDRLAADEARRPFDLRRGPLLRAQIVRRSEHDYLLLLTLHHIISDGWSMGILFSELTQLYTAEATRRPAQLPPLPIQYADFSQWQREYLSGARLTRLLGYWRRQLEGAPPVLQLPTDRARPAAQSFRGATQMFAVSEEVTQGLKELSQAEGATLFMTLAAAFTTLLYRYTGQTDVVMGTPIANRNRREIEGLIGFFVNTLVLRTNLAGDPRFRELVGRVREVALGAYEHQDLPFEKLVEELQPERNLNYNPLFQVMFSLQNNPTSGASDEQQASLEALKNAPQLGAARFDLALFTEETEKGFVAGLEYNTDLFEAATIERMVEHFQTLLEGIVAHPDRRLSELTLMTEAEQFQLLHEWNQTQADYPHDACIQQLFEKQAEQTPEATAIVMEARSWTYQEVNRRANQVAHYLHKLGVGTESRVGICMNRSAEMFIGLLGVLKAGGSYVPLDPAYPKERTAFVLLDAQARVLLTENRLAEQLPTEGLQVVRLDTEWEAIAREDERNPASDATPDNLAYIIYTSGSTGTPKGVAMPHRPLVNLLWWQTRNSELTHAARTLQFASPSFDVSFQEIFSTWLTGGTLFLTTEENRRDARRLLEVLSRFGVERLFVPPVTLQQMGEAMRDSTPPLKLRQIVVAGEQLHITEPIKRFFERLDNCTLHNHYGPSESHVVTAFTLAGVPADWPSFPYIGRPIANAQIYILGDRLQPVPVGVSGELYIGGTVLSRGYLDRPAHTAERFIPSPFSATPGEWLYKTGDLACYLPDGQIKFQGRVDDQAKIRGFRVEPGEIEVVLSQHPGVREVVVVARSETSGDKRLVAYLVADGGSPPSTTELHRFLKERVPEYMIPSVFVQLDALPLTGSGKIDRRALPAPDRLRPKLELVFVPPRTPIEEALAEIWKDVLGVERVGVHDNFFELGGHSLLATRVVSHVRDTLQVELPLRRLFESPTIAELVVGIVHSRAQEVDQEKITDLLAALEHLSEDEARALLAGED